MPVRANKDIWILGDTFLTEAVAVLREIQNQNRDDLYLYSEYDPQIYYPKLMSTDSFATQIRCQLFTALEEHNKLPSVIILVIGNKNVDQKALNPEGTRKVWKALFTEIQRAIRVRKEDLPKKAQNKFEPRVFTTNMFPRAKDHNERCDLTGEAFKTKRRRLNGILPQVANDYGFNILQINGILPDNTELFTVGTGNLNGKGLKEYWYSVSRELKIADVKAEELRKSAIIQEYFDQKVEQRRVEQERMKANKERHSLPRSVHPRPYDRGDMENPRFKERSHSVPLRKQNKRGNRRN